MSLRRGTASSVRDLRRGGPGARLAARPYSYTQQHGILLQPARALLRMLHPILTRSILYRSDGCVAVRGGLNGQRVVPGAVGLIDDGGVLAAPDGSGAGGVTGAPPGARRVVAARLPLPPARHRGGRVSGARARLSGRARHPRLRPGHAGPGLRGPPTQSTRRRLCALPITEPGAVRATHVYRSGAHGPPQRTWPGHTRAVVAR